MKQGKLFFWSDPHFGHANAIKYCKRPFSSVAEMNEKLIHNYNKDIGPNDTCIWVGDCFMLRKKEAKEILSRLNGKKVLVLGNHDGNMESMINLGFDWACYEMSIRLDGHTVQIKHYPKRPKWYKVMWLSLKGIKLRYLNRRPKDVGQFLIHGHTHSKNKFNNREIHVGVDAWNFKPVPVGAILKYIRKVDPTQKSRKLRKEFANNKDIAKEKANEQSR